MYEEIDGCGVGGTCTRKLTIESIRCPELERCKRMWRRAGELKLAQQAHSRVLRHSPHLTRACVGGRGWRVMESIWNNHNLS